MTAPCKDCPFRTDKPEHEGWLGEARAIDIANSLFSGKTFSCHKTTVLDDDGNNTYPSAEQMCAGALILLENSETPNQMVRIAGRIGLYDHTKLKIDSPVFGDFDGFVDFHTKESG